MRFKLLQPKQLLLHMDICDMETPLDPTPNMDLATGQPPTWTRLQDTWGPVWFLLKVLEDTQ